VNLHAEFIRTGQRGRTPAVPAPPPPPKVMSNEALKALGKTSWDVARMAIEQDDRFFLLTKNDFEKRELLQVRKDIWDWAVMCVEGEKRDLFCSHVVRNVDKWDVNQGCKNFWVLKVLGIMAAESVRSSR